MGVKGNLKLIFNYFKLNIRKEYKYKTAFYMQIIMMILNDLFFVIQWFIIFKLVDNIGGYGFKETMLLWAITAGGYGVSHAFFGGAWHMKEIVYEGRLDVYLTQPKNALINVCCSTTSVSAIGDIIYSYVVLIMVGAPWHWYLIMPVISVLSGLVYVSVYVVYSSFCFYVNRGDAMGKMVESTINKVGSYPPAIFNNVVKFLLATLIPAFFYSFVPVQYFLLTPSIWGILIMFGVTAIWVLLAFLSFNKGIKRYNSGNLLGGRL